MHEKILCIIKKHSETNFLMLSSLVGQIDLFRLNILYCIQKELHGCITDYNKKRALEPSGKQK